LKLLVGLGNPGRRYARTRHNLGFMVVDHLAAENGVSFKKKLCEALVGEWQVDGQTVLLAKPQTYMNRSGLAVQGLMREFRTSSEDLVVVYDELDLPFGRIRVRSRGGSAGHGGLRSIIDHLGEQLFYRVRVGIGRPPDGIEPADFVLDRFTSEEVTQLDDIIARAAEGVACLVREGGQRAMEQYNRRT
jgi:PTH1 family peptidyl-tRNA hydrolase